MAFFLKANVHGLVEWRFVATANDCDDVRRRWQVRGPREVHPESLGDFLDGILSEDELKHPVEAIQLLGFLAVNLQRVKASPEYTRQLLLACCVIRQRNRGRLLIDGGQLLPVRVYSQLLLCREFR